MNHEKFIAILLWAFFTYVAGSVIYSCSRCELNGGTYIRGITRDHCLDPSTGKALPR